MAIDLRRTAAVCSVAILSVLLWCAQATAQGGDQSWSRPIDLFVVNTDEEGVWSPAIVADSGGALYAFWIYFYQDAGQAIYYARRDSSGWSNPNDIMFSPDQGSVVELSVALDSRGYLHLAWLGRSTFSQAYKIYYTRAHVLRADSIGGWLTPVVMAVVPDYVVRRASPILTTDKPGNVHMLFWDYLSGAYSLYYIKSVDGGNTWSRPVRVSGFDPNEFMRPCALAVGGDGRFHLAWARYPLYSPSLDIMSANYYPGLWYSQSEDGGSSWGLPVEIAGVGRSGHGFGELNVAALDNDEVHLVWNGSGDVNGRYHQWSNDGGRSWTKPTRILGIGGQAGIPALVVDSDGVLHVITAGGDQPAVHLWWESERWSRPESFDVGGYHELPAATITEGNNLHVIGLGYRAGQADEGFRRVWYVSRRLSSRYVPPQPVPTPLPTATATSTPPVTPALTPSPKPAIGGSQAKPAISSSESVTVLSNISVWYPLAAGILPAALILAAVAFTRAFKPRSSR